MGISTIIGTILITGAAFGQSPSTDATFVAADVHPTPKEEFSFTFVNLAPGNRVILRGLTLTHMIALAYGVNDDKISGGPKWLDVDRYDVIAKPPTTTAKTPELQAMLQALLAQRFQLKAHREDKSFSVYVWTPAKNGLRLTPSKNDTEGECDSQPGDGFIIRKCAGMTIEELGQQLRLFANGYFNREVLDRTGAKGRFDFALKWSGRGQIGRLPDAISLYDVLEKQYGIKTGEDTVSLPAIVVESAIETRRRIRPIRTRCCRRCPRSSKWLASRSTKTHRRR